MSRRTTLAEVIEDRILQTGQRCFLVSDNHHLEGLVTLHEVKGIPRDRWPATPVEAAMIPFRQLHTVTPQTPVLDVLALMDTADVSEVPVTEQGRLRGIITRDRLLRIIRARMEMAGSGGHE